MKLQVLSRTEQEFVEAVNYYDEQFPCLGYEFAFEVKNTFDRISSFPKAWPGISSRPQTLFPQHWTPPNVVSVHV